MDWKKAEHITDALIPYALVVLIVILVVEFTAPQYAHSWWIEALDGIIVAIFVVDLAFKFHHAKSIPFFLRQYWLEIIAVFPFFLVFRVLDGLGLLTFRAGEAVVKESQSLLHAGSAVEKEAVAVGRTLTTAEREAAAVLRTASTIERDVAVAGRLTRAQRLVRFIRPLFDARKLAHAASFFEHPKQRAMPATLPPERH